MQFSRLLRCLGGDELFDKGNEALSHGAGHQILRRPGSAVEIDRHRLKSALTRTTTSPTSDNFSLARRLQGPGAGTSRDVTRRCPESNETPVEVNHERRSESAI